MAARVTTRRPGTNRRAIKASRAADSTASSSARAKEGARKRREGPGLFRRLLGTLPALLVAGLIVWTALFYWLVPDLPDTAELVQQSRQARVTLVAGNGEILAERGIAGRSYVKLDEISPYLEAAVLSVEDRRFYSHFGLDVIGTARAMLTNLSSGALVAGGSTITQQLAKNLYLSPERSLTRKLKELILAIWLEAQLTKEQILEVYFNRVYFGAGAYGVEAASQLYFAKPAADLDPAEAAMLAGLLKAPSRYAPTNDIERARARAATVARTMADNGVLSPEDAQAIIDNPAALARREETGRADHFSALVLDRIGEVLGKPRGELVVRTTLDGALQSGMERAVEAKLAAHANVQAAAVILGADGAIKALVGGRSRFGDHLNRAIAPPRQPGSAFKAIVYAAAFEQGFTPQDRITDEPFSVDGWTPRNAGGQYFGQVSLDDAFARSINTVAVKLSETIGRDAVIAQARAMGITSPLRSVASLPLGTLEVTPLELASAYLAILADGVHREPFAIARISDGSGDVIARMQGQENRAFSPTTAAYLRGLLRHTVEAGSGRRAAIEGRNIGGKTGTTQNNRDAWFVGFAGSHVIAVWVGRDDQRGMDGISGSNLPAELFRDIALSLPDLPVVAAPPPRPGTPERARADDVPQGADREDGLARLMRWVDGIFADRP